VTQDLTPYSVPAARDSESRVETAYQLGYVPGASSGSGELAQIRKIMKTDMARYWGDPDLQARYRQLLEPDGDATQEQERGRLMPMRSIADWARDGNDRADYRAHEVLVREVNDILMAMPEQDRDSLGRIFAGLPAAVHAAAFTELVYPRAIGADPMGEGGMKELMQVPVYAKLAAEWGGQASKKFGLLQARLWRILDRLNDNDTQFAIWFLERIPASAMMVIARKLAG
jgi:hypothetical protein